MAVIPGEQLAIARRLQTPTLARPPAGPAGVLANGANNLRDVTTGQGAYGGRYTLPPDPGVLRGYLNAQPGVSSAYGNMTFGGGQADSIRNTGLQQLLIGYGDPGLVKQFSGLGLDPQTAALAQAATHPQQGAWGNSTLAQLSYQADQDKRQAMAQMLSSGQAGSGQLGIQTQQQSMDLAKNTSDALSSLQDKITGLNQTDLQTHLGLRSDYAKSLQDAYTNVLNHPSQFPMPHSTIQGVGAAPKPQTPYGTGQAPGSNNAAPAGPVRPWRVPQGPTAPTTFMPAAAPHGGAV